jgi:hypothetical protein
MKGALLFDIIIASAEAPACCSSEAFQNDADEQPSSV